MELILQPENKRKWCEELALVTHMGWDETGGRQLPWSWRRNMSSMIGTSGSVEEENTKL